MPLQQLLWNIKGIKTTLFLPSLCSSKQKNMRKKSHNHPCDANKMHSKCSSFRHSSHTVHCWDGSSFESMKGEWRRNRGQVGLVSPLLLLPTDKQQHSLSSDLTVWSQFDGVTKVHCFLELTGGEMFAFSKSCLSKFVKRQVFLAAAIFLGKSVMNSALHLEHILSGMCHVVHFADSHDGNCCDERMVKANQWSKHFWQCMSSESLVSCQWTGQIVNQTLMSWCCQKEKVSWFNTSFLHPNMMRL